MLNWHCIVHETNNACSVQKFSKEIHTHNYETYFRYGQIINDCCNLVSFYTEIHFRSLICSLAHLFISIRSAEWQLTFSHRRRTFFPSKWIVKPEFSVQKSNAKIDDLVKTQENFQFKRHHLYITCLKWRTEPFQWITDIIIGTR